MVIFHSCYFTKGIVSLAVRRISFCWSCGMTFLLDGFVFINYRASRKTLVHQFGPLKQFLPASNHRSRAPSGATLGFAAVAGHGMSKHDVFQWLKKPDSIMWIDMTWRWVKSFMHAAGAWTFARLRIHIKSGMFGAHLRDIPILSTCPQWSQICGFWAVFHGKKGLEFMGWTSGAPAIAAQMLLPCIVAPQDSPSNRDAKNSLPVCLTTNQS